MNKKIIPIIVIAIILVAIFFAVRWFSGNGSSQYNDSNYQARKTYLNETNTTKNTDIEPIETELYSFSTNILTDSKNRLTNIKITCSRINETVIKAGKEFSFCDIVGQPTSADGYKPADAFGADGEVIQAIGGGNCQVSTTIYNAVLKVDGLKVTERHEHSRDVAYIADGKDATVAYDYLDLKFKNTNKYDIKLYSFVSDNKVTVKIFKVE